MQSNFSLVSPPYRGNTVSYDGESASGLWWFWLRFWFVALFCFGLGVFWCFIPDHHVVFPFLSTMTWAHRPHGVRTRAKKKTARNSAENAIHLWTFFLHGYGRYVCREAQVTLNEFEKKAEKIRATQFIFGHVNECDLVLSRATRCGDSACRLCGDPPSE